MGENIVQGTVTSDEFHVFKPAIGKNKRCIISKKIGSKAKTLVYNSNGIGTVNTDTPFDKQKKWTLNDAEIETSAKWALQIEQHYKMPMDIEWTKDGNSAQLFILQARPKTVHSSKNPLLVKEYKLKNKGEFLVSGNAVGTGIASGVARILKSPADSDKLQTGEVIVTDNTNPAQNEKMCRMPYCRSVELSRYDCAGVRRDTKCRTCWEICRVDQYSIRER